VTNITNTTGSSENVFPAIDPIRVEMLSTEMPVHQLSKRGEEEIRIIRRATKGGQVSVYWKVEPNVAVGHPGQLAYRLDTWVIKRRLDQLPRPIPRLIRVGDLRQISRELDHGGDTNAVKRAFEQNASAFIRAKIAYRARDGREETFEGYFNRYNVFFRGQSLPGGTRAETVYISLNDPYHALINGSIWRPLDYQYLRTLTPAAQRLYELLSPKIFAASISQPRRAKEIKKAFQNISAVFCMADSSSGHDWPRRRSGDAQSSIVVSGKRFTVHATNYGVTNARPSEWQH